jgi:lipopolysaccharide/colanic/teichoic acid biosynthesis glycosyltransferase/glycosyltransferase involved in cell wall biosynthesis
MQCSKQRSDVHVGIALSMKILLLTQWFEPEPTFKGLFFAQELAGRGHEVEVLTGFPNYPGGKLYPGYRIRPWLREETGGIRVLRVALYPSHSNSGVCRALNYISFALSAAVIGTALITKPDVVYVYHPPITVGFAAAVISFFRNTPFVYDIQDLWPDTVAASGMMSNPITLTLLSKLCKVVYRRARHITVLSLGFKEQLVRRGVPPDKIDVIYNWCDETALKLKGGPVTRLCSADRFCILFAGTMGHVQGLDSVLHAAQICQTAVPAAEFLFMGGGVDRDRLQSMALEMHLDNVRFLPRQPMHCMGAILAGADALLVHLKDDPLFRITIPSKTQAYLAAGKPILMAVRGEATSLITSSGAGIMCQPRDPGSIAAAVKELAEAGKNRLAEMGRNGAAFYERELSVSVGVGKFERIFKAVTNKVVLETDTHAGACPRPAAWQKSGRSMSFYREFGKRAFDVICASAALILFAPFLAIVAVLVKIKLGSPIIFRQLRPGKYADPFILLKFRTMNDTKDPAGRLLPDEERLTKLGRFLRSYSLDELPQLWNVIRGDMSLVGPRPLLMKYLSLYAPEQARRHEVRPGVTGWAQVNGRNAVSWNNKFALDTWYVDHWSLRVDVTILANTAWLVYRRKDISSQGYATMPEFTGVAQQKRDEAQ